MRSRPLTDIRDLYGHLFDESVARRHFLSKMLAGGHHFQERIAQHRASAG